MKPILNNKFFQLGLMLAVGLLAGWLIFYSWEPEEGHVHTHEAGEETTYTCSMHPQIRQDEPGDCPICGMELIPAEQKSDKTESSPFVHTMSAEAMALANVQTQKIEAVKPRHDVQLTGKIKVNEQKLEVITANFPGRIEKLLIDFTGQTVNKGEKLATIYSPQLITAQKELIQAAKHKDVNYALYNAAKEKLRLWKITEKQINQIESTGKVLNELDVYAHQSGVVISREVTKGSYVNKGSLLFKIADLKNVWALFDAYESDLPFLRTGQKITFTVASLPGRDFSSSISFIDPWIDPETRTAAVRAEVQNAQLELKPGMFVNGNVKSTLNVNEKALVIPATAVLWTGKRSVVYVKVQNAEFPAFEMRQIVTGPSMGEYYVVKSGLQEGEEVVTNGVFAIDAAAQLSGKYSMMNLPHDKTIPAPDKFIAQLTDFLNQYFELKNSLVDSDFERALSAAGEKQLLLSNVDMELLDNEAHSAWMKHQPHLKNKINQLEQAKDIDQQRETFAPLSERLAGIVETFGVDREVVFLTYCPMAFDDEGAFWISEFEEIKNPYFGDQMLACGEIKKKIGTKRERQPQTEQHQGHQH